MQAKGFIVDFLLTCRGDHACRVAVPNIVRASGATTTPQDYQGDEEMAVHLSGKDS